MYKKCVCLKKSVFYVDGQWLAIKTQFIKVTNKIKRCLLLFFSYMFGRFRNVFKCGILHSFFFFLLSSKTLVNLLNLDKKCHLMNNEEIIIFQKNNN